MRQTLLLILLLQALLMSAQGYISIDNFSTSRLRNETGDNFGSGSMWMISGGYNIPIYTKINDRKQVKSFSASAYATYADLSNEGEASQMNPAKIINSGLNLTYIQPISKKWSVLLTGGAGVYAPAGEINLKSVLGNGGAIFICRLNDNLSLGIGGGVTNSYGTPMAMPMMYLNWQRNGKFAFNIDMGNRIKASVSTTLWNRLTLELTPIEIDGLTAVTSRGDKEQIYSMIMLHSYFSPSFRLNDKLSIFGKVGGNWIRGISETERSLKAFFDSFKDADKDDPYFNVSLRLSAGIRFCF